jgi:hypothetical protein
MGSVNRPFGAGWRRTTISPNHSNFPKAQAGGWKATSATLKETLSLKDLPRRVRRLKGSLESRQRVGCHEPILQKHKAKEALRLHS